MSALRDIVIAQIVENGPMSVADYMQLCLLHPEHGYYVSRDPFGKTGDFTTAPEVSQMFGELLGLALAQAWIDQGQPANMLLAELGPGRGTLMADMLRAIEKIPDLTPQVHLIEASDRLRLAQAETIRGYYLTWHDRIEQLPEGPLFIIANEFFDALPIRQFVRGSEHWHERRVGRLNDVLSFGLAGEAPVGALQDLQSGIREGQMIELCPAAGPIMEALDYRIAQHGGAAIIVDYGNWGSLGDTLQAVSGHAYANPLANPGEADLTAHVDFEALSAATSLCAVAPMITQGELLKRLGIDTRAARLAQDLSGLARQLHESALRRLTHEDEMGTLFKAIALSPRGAPQVAGFDA